MNKARMLLLTLTVIAVNFILTRPASAQNYDKADWQNQAVSGINKQPSQNTAWPCPDAKTAWKSNYDYSPWVLSLDGSWSFHWAQDPYSNPKIFFLPVRDFITVNIDDVQMGAGGDDSWGYSVKPEYPILKKGNYSFEFELKKQR